MTNSTLSKRYLKSIDAHLKNVIKVNKGIRYNNKDKNNKDLLMCYLELSRYRKVGNNNFEYEYIYKDLKDLSLYPRKKEEKQEIKSGTQVHFVNTGNGDAICIENNGECAIIDFGGLNGKFNKYVNKNISEHKIKYSFITHLHLDHIKDYLRVSKSKDLETLVLLNNIDRKNIDDLSKNFSYIEKSNARYIKFIDIKDIENKNVKFTLGDASLEIIYPNEVDKISINDSSLVIKMDYAGRSILFTGDIENTGEEKLIKILEKNFDISKIAVIKVAHHASKESSTESFLQMFENVEDFIALLNEQREYENYEIFERLEKHGKVYMSSRDGDIRLDISKEGEIVVTTERQKIMQEEKEQEKSLNAIIKSFYHDLHLKYNEKDRYDLYENSVM